MLVTNPQNLNYLAYTRRRAAFLPWHYTYIRAYNELFRALPIEWLIDQNYAAIVGAPLDTVRFDCRRVPILTCDIIDPIWRKYVEDRGAEIMRRQLDFEALESAMREAMQ